MNKKILIVVTSNDELGDSGEKTGFHLSELTIPFFTFLEAGFHIDIASPKGGEAPIDPNSYDLKIDENEKFMHEHGDKIQHTLTLSQVRPEEYDAVFFPGGHGPMWDLSQNTTIPNIVNSIFNKGGVIGAVCHGPAALVNVMIEGSSEYFVKNRSLTAFSDSEEKKVKKDSIVPFLLESKLKERGADYSSSFIPMTKHVVEDSSEQLVTGQNPAASKKVAETIVKLLDKKLKETSMQTHSKREHGLKRD